MKISTKRVDGFFEVVDNPAEGRYFFGPSVMSKKKTDKEPRTSEKTNAPEFVSCVRRSPRSDLIISFKLSFCSLAAR